MRTLQIVLAVLSALLVAFALICGFWIHNPGNAAADIESSLRFHMWTGIAAGVTVLASAVVTLVRK